MLDAFHMTVITLTAVGYTEVHPLDAPGKLATAGPQWLSCADRVPCLVIDPKPELAALLDEHDVPHLATDPAEEAVLRRAGVERAAGLLCAVDSDAVNAHPALTACSMNPKLTIVACASNPESVDKVHRLGADQVSPTISEAQ